VRLSSSRRLRIAARGLPVMVLVLLTTLAAAPSVAAHHASVKASASCVDGHYVIDWRALSWVATDGTTDAGRTAEPWRGLNQKPGITITYRLGWHGRVKTVDGVRTLTAANTTAVVVKGKVRQFPSASGSFDLPGTTKGVLVLRVKAGPWGPNPANGRYVHHDWSHDGYLASVDLKGDCRKGDTPPPVPAPAVPDASAASACVGTSAVIRVELTNGNVAGGAAFAFTVSAPAAGSKPSFSQAATVAAHSSTSLDIPVDENGSRTVTVAGTGFSRTFTRTGDCVADPEPNVEAAQVCSNGLGAIRLTLANTNPAAGEPITFTVTSPATGSQPAYTMVIALNGGEVRNLDVPVDEDGARTVTVAAPGMSTASFTRTVDCDSPAQPVASAYSFCDGTVGKIVMTVANRNEPGGGSVVFTIHLDGAGTQPALDRTVEVAGGGSVEVTEIADEDTNRRGTIDAPGMTTLVFTLGADCI
jgi:hypothetical protein